MSEFRAWLVDLDGTLYHSWPVKLAMAVELLSATREERQVIRAFRHQHEAVRRFGSQSQQGCPFETQIVAAAEQLKLSANHVFEIIDQWMFLRPGHWLRMFRRSSLILELTKFRQADGRLALVSDYPARTKLAALGVEDLFDVVIASGEEDGPTRLKPDPEGYLKAAARLGVEPAECLVIGDRTDADGAAAARAGMSFRRIPGSRIQTTQSLSARVSEVCHAH